MSDPRMRYAVQADMARERGEWLFAEVARQRGAELAMRPPEEWEIDRPVPVETITYWGIDPAFREGDWVQLNGVDIGTHHRVLRVDPATRTITLTTSNVRESVGISYRRRCKRAPDPKAKPSRVPERFQKTRLDGRRQI